MLDLNSLERHLKLCKAELADAEKLFTDLREAVKETLEAQIRHLTASDMLKPCFFC